MEPGSGKHSIYSHFPKDPNCDICLKTKITSSSCRRRAGTVVPKAENFGDSTTTDDKKLSVKKVNPATIIDTPLWYKIWQHCGYNPTLAKTRTSQETQMSLMKFLEPTRKPKVIYTDNSLVFGKSCGELSWNHYPWNHCTDRNTNTDCRKSITQHCVE